MRLVNRGDAPPQKQDFGLGYYTTYITLEGKKVATGVGSMDDGWDFTLYVNYYNTQNKTGGEPLAKFTKARITHELVNGKENGVLLYYTGEPGSDDPQQQAAAEQESKQNSREEIKKIAGLPKSEALPEIEATKVPFPETVYLADFTITAGGRLGAISHDGYAQGPGGGGKAEKDKPEYVGKLIYNVQLQVDDMGYATAVITLTDALGYPHTWRLEGFMGKEQPKKPPKKPQQHGDDCLCPVGTHDDDLAPVGWDDPPGTKPTKPADDDDLAPVGSDPPGTKPPKQEPKNPLDPDFTFDDDPLAPVR
jgi:hypothetical protein